jgi:hypothetical protein
MNRTLMSNKYSFFKESDMSGIEQIGAKSKNQLLAFIVQYRLQKTMSEKYSIGGNIKCQVESLVFDV